MSYASKPYFMTVEHYDRIFNNPLPDDAVSDDVFLSLYNMELDQCVSFYPADWAEKSGMKRLKDKCEAMRLKTGRVYRVARDGLHECICVIRIG